MAILTMDAFLGVVTCGPFLKFRICGYAPKLAVVTGSAVIAVPIQGMKAIVTRKNVIIRSIKKLSPLGWPSEAYGQNTRIT